MSNIPDATSLIAAICAIAFCIVGILGNVITILALCRCPKLRAHATTYFVISLCVSDLVFCAVNLPLTVSRYISKEWTLGEPLCMLFPVLFYGNVAVSLVNMVGITINRYILISHNQYYNTIYAKWSIWLQLSSAYILAFLIMVPPLFGLWGQLGLDPQTFSCTILKKNGKSPKKIIFALGFVIPCLVIIISYSFIYCKVRESKRRLEAHSSHSKLPGPGATKKESRVQRRRERDDNRLTKMMLLIFVSFLTCFLPLMLANVLDVGATYPSIDVVASILAWLSSVINPFIYAASNVQYRHAYVALFTALRTRVHLSESVPLSDATPTSRPQDKFKSTEQSLSKC